MGPRGIIGRCWSSGVLLLGSMGKSSGCMDKKGCFEDNCHSWVGFGRALQQLFVGAKFGWLLLLSGWLLLSGASEGSLLSTGAVGMEVPGGLWVVVG